MEIIALDSELKEKYPVVIDVDFEAGDSSARNDFEISAEDVGEYAFYVPGTEFGGVIEFEEGFTKKKTHTIKGWTWRGLLTQWFIEPDAGSNYKIVKGEANSIMGNLLENILGGFFVVPDVDSGLTIESYQFKLHCSVLDGFMDMLSSHGYRLKINAKRTKVGKPISIFCEAVPVKRVEGTYDEDTGLNIAFTNNRMGVNHLICWGSGQLQERQRLDLFLDEEGNISGTQVYFGFHERQAVFDYGNAESLDDLRQHGMERLREIASSKNLQIDEVEGVDMEIGDIVVGRKNDIGLIVEKPIVRKILRISDGKTSIEYKVKGEG